MDIGRTSLRTALVLLYEDGYIVTKQGKGSFVTYDPSSNAEQYQSKYISLKKRLEPSHPGVVIKQFFDREIEGDAFLDEKLGADGKKIRCYANVYSDKSITTKIKKG